MITSFHLKNFKSIDVESPIKLSEYSVFCGSNSSGKSSIVQALLMLSQTLSSRYSRGTIALNGHLVRLGSFSDIKSSFGSADEVCIALELDLSRYQSWRGGMNKAALELSFGKLRKSASLEDELHPVIMSAKIVLEGEDGTIERLDFSQPTQDDEYAHQNNLYAVKYIGFSDSETALKQYPDYVVLGCDKDNIIPSALVVDYDHTKKISAQVIEMLTGQGLRRHRRQISDIDESEVNLHGFFFSTLRQLILAERAEAARGFELPEEIASLLKARNNDRDIDVSAIKQEILNVRFGLTPEVIPDYFLNEVSTPMGEWLLYINTLDEKTKKYLVEFIDKHRTALQDAWYSGAKKTRKIGKIELRSFGTAFYYISYYFERSLKYLGPLRNEPLPIYPALGLVEPTNVGLKGEYSAAILHINRYRKINYPSPFLEDGKISFVSKNSTLETACQEWLSYLGVVQKVMTSDKGKLGYELSVKTHANDKWQDLTHVGVGVSQVLPIVLMSLLSESDEILIFEQPELHLHPKVQSRLCDFFIALSFWKRQCLIETHSEYLINRLRLRIAQSRTSELLDSSSIIFLSKFEGRTTFKEVEISKYGAIVEWPEDFFDQTDKEVESILIEATKKRKEAKGEVGK